MPDGVVIMSANDLIIYMIIAFVPLYTLLSIYTFFTIVNMYGPQYASTLSRYLVKVLALILLAGFILLGILHVIDIKLVVNVGVSTG